MKGKNALDFIYSKHGLSIPSEEQIETVRKNFEKDVNRIFNEEVTIFSEDEMEDLLYNSIDESEEFSIVSLDKIYFNKKRSNDFYLDCTRLEGSSKLVARNNPDSSNGVEKQIKRISKKVKARGKNEIIIVDDVVFSGNVLRTLIEIFMENGVKVSGVRSAISTEESYNYFNRHLSKGLRCGCILGKDVIDQVCERDFYFGIAQSGISIKDDSGKIMKSPYFKPFGNPIQRASIPKEAEKFFSNGCIMRSMYIWKCIEENSKNKIFIKDLPEEIVNTNNKERVIDTLRKGLIYDEKITDRSNGECR